VREPPEQVRRCNSPEEVKIRIAGISRAAGAFSAAIRETKARLEKQRCASQHVDTQACQDDAAIDVSDRILKQSKKIPWSWKISSKKSEDVLELEVAQHEVSEPVARSLEFTAKSDAATSSSTLLPESDTPLVPTESDGSIGTDSSSTEPVAEANAKSEVATKSEETIGTDSPSTSGLDRLLHAEISSPAQHKPTRRRSKWQSLHLGMDVVAPSAQDDLAGSLPNYQNTHAIVEGSPVETSKVQGSTGSVISTVATPSGSRKVCVAIPCTDDVPTSNPIEAKKDRPVPALQLDSVKVPTTPEQKRTKLSSRFSTGRASLGSDDLGLGQEPPLSANDEEEKLVESPTKAHIDDAVVTWRREVESITNSIHDGGPTADEDAEDIAELLQLLEQDSFPRSGVTVEGVQPVLVTAPHCIPLLRDGHPVHLVEEYTATIAQALTQKVNGTSLMWTSAEQRRVELLWSFGKKRGTKGWTLLDPRNRDPNYLATVELAENSWHQQMLSTAASWRACLGQDVSTLHFDVHGCRDPPHTPSHLTVGLGAMLTEARNSGVADRVACVKAFGEALEHELTKVLTRMRLWPKVQLIRVIVPTAWDKHMRFAGAWAPNTQRHTQTQQAVAFAGFDFSVQLEMSKTLRRGLLQNRQSLDEFGGALIAAWQTAQRCRRDAALEYVSPDAILW